MQGDRIFHYQISNLLYSNLEEELWEMLFHIVSDRVNGQVNKMVIGQYASKDSPPYPNLFSHYIHPSKLALKHKLSPKIHESQLRTTALWFPLLELPSRKDPTLKGLITLYRVQTHHNKIIKNVYQTLLRTWKTLLPCQVELKEYKGLSTYVLSS